MSQAHGIFQPRCPIMSWFHALLHFHSCCHPCLPQFTLPMAARGSLSYQTLLTPHQRLYYTLEINPQSWPETLSPCMVWPLWPSQPCFFLFSCPYSARATPASLLFLTLPHTNPRATALALPAVWNTDALNSYKPLSLASFMSQLREALPTTLP